MMRIRHIATLLLLFALVFSAKGQITVPIYDSSDIPLPPRYYTKRIDNQLSIPNRIDKKSRLPRMIDNIGLWYLIQGIKADMPNDPELRDAIKVLTKYAENRTLQNQINAFRRITEKTGEKIESMNYIQRKVTFDSIRYAEDYVEHNDLQLLISTIREDSNFQWLTKVSRDSVLLDIVDSNEDVVQSLWIHGKRHQYRRVWFKTMSGDTIRTWLETLPGGTKIRINIDESASDHRLEDLVIENKDFKQKNELDLSRFNFGLNKGSIQKKLWTGYTSYNLNLTQAANKNWQGGGLNSFSVLFKFGAFVNYNKNRLSFENYLKYNLGMVLYEGSSPRKSDDYFEFNTKLGYKTSSGSWYYTLQLNLQTQLFNSYKYSDSDRKLVANFMSPTYIVPSIGMNFKPNKRVSLLLAQASGKMTYIRDIEKVPPTNYGVKENRHIKSSVGFNINYNHTSKTLWKFLDIISYLDAFVYYNIKDYDIPVYAYWKGTFKFNINTFMNATLYMEAKYDENSSKKIQFKENLGLGFSFYI